MPITKLPPPGPPGGKGDPGSPGAGIIPGGAAGQVLTKLSVADFDTGWQTPAPAGVTSVNTKTGAVSLTQDDVPDGVAAKQYPAADKTKLAGIAAGATVNATDAALRDRATHTGTQSADTLTDGATNKAFLATERTKLAGIAAGAQVNSVTSVAAKTGAVTLVKADVGLGSVDNTSDLDKPVSTAQQTAINGRALLNHTHTQLQTHYAPDTDSATTALHHTLGTGATQAAAGDHTHAGVYAPLASPAFTGTPTTPTAATSANSTQVASTEFVQNNISQMTLSINSTYAKIASPALTGTPTAPTAAPGTNTTQLATTAFVAANSSVSPLTTKGDLYGRGASADARVPVGADGQALVADSTKAAGVGWGVRQIALIRQNTNHYCTVANTVQQASAGWFPVAANTIYFTPLTIPGAMTITAIRIGIRTASAAGNLRIGLFRAPLPVPTTATMVAEFGTVSTATTGTKDITGLSVPVGGDSYRIAILADQACELLGFNGKPWATDGYDGIGGSCNLFAAQAYGPFAPSYVNINDSGTPVNAVFHAGVK